MKRRLSFAFAAFTVATLASAIGFGGVGEWESSGAPTPPYIPPGEINYHCVITLTEQTGGRPQDYKTHTIERDLKTPDFRASGSVVVSIEGQEFSLRFTRDHANREVVHLYTELHVGRQDSAWQMSHALRSEGAIDGVVGLSHANVSHALEVGCTAL